MLENNKGKKNHNDLCFHIKNFVRKEQINLKKVVQKQLT